MNSLLFPHKCHICGSEYKTKKELTIHYQTDKVCKYWVNLDKYITKNTKFVEMMMEGCKYIKSNANIVIYESDKTDNTDSNK